MIQPPRASLGCPLSRPICVPVLLDLTTFIPAYIARVIREVDRRFEVHATIFTICAFFGTVFRARVVNSIGI